MVRVREVATLARGEIGRSPVVRRAVEGEILELPPNLFRLTAYTLKLAPAYTSLPLFRDDVQADGHAAKQIAARVRENSEV